MVRMRPALRVSLSILAVLAIHSSIGGAAAPEVWIEGKATYTYLGDAVRGAEFVLHNDGSTPIWLPHTDSFEIRNSDAVVYFGTALFIIGSLGPGESVKGIWNFSRDCYYFAGSNPCNGPAPPGTYFIDWYFYPTPELDRLEKTTLAFEIELI